MTANWRTFRIVLVSVIGTLTAQLLALAALGWLVDQATRRDEAERAEIYRAAARRLGLPETTRAEQIRQFVDCERLPPGTPREFVEATLGQLGPYTAHGRDAQTLSIQFEDALWQGLFYARDYTFDAENRLVAVTARDGSAFPAVECPWPYVRPANE